MRPPREDTLPWYRQFWPWFLIALPGSVVIASIITITLAVKTSDSLVRDDYYKEGLAINRNLARERMAAELGVRIQLDYDAATQTLTASLNDAPVGMLDELVLQLVHPTLNALDTEIRLSQTADARYTGVAGHPLNDIAWHLEIGPNGESWKISNRWNPVSQPSLELQPTFND